jgi:hypothetical protein
MTTQNSGAPIQGASSSYTDALAQSESSNNYQAVNQFGYLGKYQFGSMALQDTGFQDAEGNWTGRAGINSAEDFLNNPAVQEAAQQEFMGKQDSYLQSNGATQYIGTTIQDVTITKEGLRAAAHLVGASKVKEMLETGTIPTDANGTSALDYMRKMSNTGNSIGEQKQAQLADRSQVKQQELVNKSKSKQLELAGLTQEEQTILDMGIDAYMQQGDYLTMGERVNQYYQLEAKRSTIEKELADAQNTAIFQDLDSTPQYVGNTALGATSTVGNIIGGLASLPSTLISTVTNIITSDEDKELFASIQAKNESGEELTPEETKFSSSYKMGMLLQNEDYKNDPEAIKAVTGALDKYVNKELTEDFTKNAASVFNDLTEGKISTVQFVKDSVELLTDNPGAIGQVTIESLPYVLSSAASLPATVASSWTNNQNEALATYAENNDGELPSGKDLANLTMLAGAQAMVDHFGDRLVGGEALQGLIKGTKVTSSLAKKATDVATGTAGEFVAEGGAEILGQLAGSAGKGSVDLSQAYASGLLGAGAGGTTSAAVNTVSGVSNAAEAVPTDKIKEKIQAASEVVKETADNVKSTVQSESDTKTQREAPTRKTTTRQKVTPEAQEATRISETITKAYESNDDAVIKEAETEFRQLRDAAKQIVQSGKSQTDLTPEEQSIVAKYSMVNATRSPLFRARKEAKAVQQANNLTTASTNNAPTKAAINEVLGSIDLGTTKIAAESIEGILNNTNLNLSEEQRVKLTNYADMVKNIDQVSNDILEGGKGFIGIKQYLDTASGAIEIGDTSSTVVALDGLKSFRASHENKLATNEHNGQPMTKSLRNQVQLEADLMDTTIQKIEADAQFAGLDLTTPTPSFSAESLKSFRAPQEIFGETESETAQANAVAGEGAVETNVSEDAQGNFSNDDATSVSSFEEDVTNAFQASDKEVANVKAVIDQVKTLNDQGLSQENALKQVAQQFDANTMELVKQALGERVTVENTATKITKAEGDQKVPVMPEAAKADIKERRKFFNSFNWVKAYFSPNSTKGNVLQRVPGLFNTNLGMSLASFIGRDLTKEESALVKNMEVHHKGFVKSFNKVYEKSKGSEGKPRHQDPQLFLHELGDDNIRDAMFATIYNWIATGSTETLFNNGSKINQMIGMDSNARTPIEAYDMLGHVGVGFTTLYESLGPDILKSINISPTQDAPAHIKSKLENSLGMMAVAVMKDMGVVKHTAIDRKVVARLNPELPQDEAGQYNFYRVAAEEGPDGNDVPVKSARVVIERLKAANASVSKTKDRLMTKAFGVEPKTKIPSFDGPAKATTKVKGRGQKITKQEQDIIAKQNARKHHIRDTAFSEFSSLPREIQEEMLGYKDVSEVHAVNRAAQDSINESIRRSLDNLNDFVIMRDESGKQDFYFSHVKWSNGRYGIDENFVNPQSNKVHRAFIAQEGWTTEIDPMSQNDWFWAAMEEPLGVGSRYEALTEYRDAIEALANFKVTGALVDSDMETIKNAVLNAGAGAESFHALSEIAGHEIALQQGVPFTTDIAIEVDGKTNGVILTMLQYADGNTSEELLKKLGKGGIYSNSYQNFNDFANATNEAGEKYNLDAYNEIAKDWMRILDITASTDGINPETMTAVKYIFGLITDIVQTENGSLSYNANKKGERNLAKSPLMVSNYGSGDASIKQSLANDFIARIYDMIQSGEDTQKAYNQVRYMVNKIVPNALPKSNTPLEVVMDARVEYRIKQLIEDTVGETANTVINERYALTKDGQKSVNEVLDLMHRYQSAVRKDLIAKAREATVNEGRGQKGIATITNRDMNAIDKAVQVMGPQVKTYYSKQSTNPDFYMDLRGKRVHAKGLGSEYTIKAEGNHAGYANAEERAAPGVAGAVVTTHSLDALIMSKMYGGDTDVLGVHDAIIVGIDEAEKASKEINQATFDAMKDVSIPNEVADSYRQSKRAFMAYLNQENVNKNELLSDVYAGLEEGAAEIKIRENNLKITLDRVKEVKEEVLKTPDLVIHQYADELGLGAVTVNQSKDEDVSPETIGKRSTEDLGSTSDNSFNPLDFEESIEVDATNVEEIFLNLPASGGKVENEAHKRFLAKQVQHFSSKIMTPFKLHMQEKEGVDNYGVMSNGDIYLTNLKQGSPVKSSLLARGIRMSPEEIMAHELNHVVYLEGLQRDSEARRTVERMFTAARNSLDYTSLLGNNANPTKNEVEAAKATFNHIFFEKRGNALAEFAAFGSTNQNFMMALNKVKTRPEKIVGSSIGETLRNLLNTIVDLFSDRLFNLKGLRQDEKLVKMLDAMHQVNASKVNGIIQAAEAASAVYSKAVQFPLQVVKKVADKALASDALLNNRFKVVSGPAQLLRAIQNENAREYLREGFNTVRDTMVGTRRGIIVSMFDEVVGRTQDNAATRDLARKANVKVDRQRKQVKTAMTKNIEDAFHTEMNADDWTAVTKVFLKNDVDVLMPLGTSKMMDILSNQEVLDGTINQYESMLAGNPNSNFYIRQAKNLGYYMNTGKSREAMGLLNAHQISKVFGDPSVTVSDAAATQVKPVIDILATLYGLKEVDSVYLNTARNILARESNVDATNNGITATVIAHANLKKEARNQFNSEDEYNVFMIKGWTKETYMAGTDVKIATDAEHKELTAQGYIRGHKISNDSADPVQEERYIYVAPEGALSPYMSTIASLTSNIAKGSGRVDVNRVWGHEEPEAAAKIDVLDINRRKAKYIKQMHASPVSPSSTENHMIPVFNPDGKIVDWRYMMSEANKDELLQKDNHAASVLGGMAGNIVDKVESEKINKELVDLIYDYHTKEKGKRDSAYVKVGVDSSEDSLREIWYQMPSNMREYAKSKFGGDYMMVRADLVTSMFGYRKFSLKSLFHKDPATQKAYEKLIVSVLSKLLGDKAALRVAQTENVIQALVQYTKDLVIVRSGVITLGNIVSNTMLLVMNGMSPIKAITKQYEAYRYSSGLISELAEVKQLQADLISKNLTNIERSRKEAEINRLNKRIQQNPTYLAYSVGLMPTIVEDVEADAEFNNTYLGKFQRAASEQIDDKLSFAPSFVRDLTKFTVGTPDSEIYKFLNSMVMQSDFMGRYAILNHWMEQQGVSESDKEFGELVGEAEELFINFDAPTHRGIQYMNDMGLAWFTKYVARINRSIARTFYKNPVSAAAAAIGVELSMLDGAVDNPAASSVFGGGDPFRVLGNPISKALAATDLSVGANVLGIR